MSKRIGGRKWFYSLGQSAADRGLRLDHAKAIVKYDSFCSWAKAAFILGFHRN